MTAPVRVEEPAPVPPSTSLRMVLVAMALVVSGLFVGTGLYNGLADDWTATILGCLAQHPQDIEAQLSCQAPAEQERAGAAVGAAAIVVLLACVIIALAPGILRRRGRLRPADRRFAPALEAIAQLARAEGRPVPGLLVGPTFMTEPFCLGRPGDYRIALPPKLALLGNRPLFQALIRHELAHLAHHDVALSWLARSLWYVLAPLLALPVLLTLGHGEPVLALDILWRSTVLIAVVMLVVRALLRAREYDADLRAARVAGVGNALDAELSRRPEPPRGWRTTLAWHPSAAGRRAVLANPASVAIVTWVDGLTLGFLAALALPIVSSIAAAALLGVRAAGLVSLAGALSVGPLFGATIGLGLWRQAFIARPADRARIRAVTLGVLVGGALGELASLAGVGLGFAQPPVAVPLALAGATALIGGLGEQWVQGRRRQGTLTGLLAAMFGAVAATGLLWAAQEAQLADVQSGWALLTTWLTTAGTLVYPGIAAVILAVAAGWATRPSRPGTAPAWLAPEADAVVELPRRRALVVGVGAGIGGGLGLVAFRVVAGRPAGDEDVLSRFDAAVLGIALVGAVAMALLALARGIPGIGAGLLAGPVAILTAGVLYLGFNAVLGGNPLAVAWPLFGAAVPAGLLLSALSGLAGLLRIPPIRSTAVIAVIAVGACALATVTVSAQRAVLVPGLPAAIPGVTPGRPIDPNRPDLQPATPRNLYLTVVAKPLLDQRIAESDAVNRLKADHPTDAVAAARVRSDVLPRATELLRLAESFRFDDPAVDAVHGHALAAARTHVEAFTILATALEAGNRAMFDQANRLIVRGDAEWETWASSAQTL